MATYLGKSPARLAIITDDTITSSKIVDNTVTSADILNATITGADLASDISFTTSGSIAFGDAGENIAGDGTDLIITSSAKLDMKVGSANPTIAFYSDGTQFGHIKRNSGNFDFRASESDRDITFRGNDGGTGITALTLDMSEGGIAKFIKSIAMGTDAISNHSTGDISGVGKLAFGSNNPNAIPRIFKNSNFLNIREGTSGLKILDPSSNTTVEIDSNQNVGICCNLTVAGNLTINGTTTTLNTATLDIEDKTLCIAKGAADAAAANGAGILVDGASASLLYNSSGDCWAFNKTLNVTNLNTLSLLKAKQILLTPLAVNNIKEIYCD